MADEKRLLGSSKDGRTLRSIANFTQMHLADSRALHAIADRLDQRKAIVDEVAKAHAGGGFIELNSDLAKQLAEATGDM